MNNILDYFNELFPYLKCELVYNSNFEFLIAVVLSAQTTDKKVNNITNILFSKYDINSLCNIDIIELECILRPLGMSYKKARYVINISNDIKYKYNSKIPDNLDDLLKLDGVGRKSANLVLSTLYNKPYFAVDTHVSRVVKRLGLVNKDCDVFQIENEMYRLIPSSIINRVHHQFVLFGRYYCKSKKPECELCKLKNICNYSNNDCN